MKKAIFGFLVGIVCMLTIPIFAETQLKIDVIFDRVKLVVNGKPTDTSTLIYDGRTYIQLRGAADVFGAKLDWDGSTNTASLTTDQKSIPIYTPAPVITPTLKPVQTTSSEVSTPITIDEISYNISVLPPDSINTIYMETAFKNNSKYTLSSIQLTYLDKIINEKQYLSTYDTLLPGDTSSKSETFGPNSGNINDLQLLETEIVILKDSGDKVYITYDHKTKRYNILGKI